MNIPKNQQFDDVSNEAYSFLTTRQLGRQFFQPYTMIYESEIQQMAGQADSWGCYETGGTLFGLFSHAFRPVIMLAMGPGPDAIHEEYRFCDDIDFLIKAIDFMRNNYGLNYIGNHHSHHFLSAKGLSNRDIQSTHSIALKNGYNRLCQIVLTFEKEATYSFSDHHRIVYNKVTKERLTKSIFSKRQAYSGVFNNTSSYQVNYIKLHPFIYLDAKNGLPLRCQIKVIPGISPIRQALEKENVLPELIKPYYFPISRIKFDAIKKETEDEKNNTRFPKRLKKQHLGLPNGAREKLEVVFKEGFIVLSLPISEPKGKLFVAYSAEFPHKATKVYFMRSIKTESLINVTSKALCFGPYTSLQTIFKRAVKVVRAMKPNNNGINQWKWLTAVNHPKSIKNNKKFN
jgi:hypothetical protein